MGADIVLGMWTCCKSIDRAAPGCVLADHSTGRESWELLHCEQCAGWIPRGRWDVDKCSHHPGELQRTQFGGLIWSCCGETGVEGSRFRNVSPSLWRDQRRLEAEARRAQGASRAQAGLSQAHDATTGCTSGRHSLQLPLDQECPVCGAAKVPGDRECQTCGDTQHVLCTQCFDVVAVSDLRRSAARGGCRFHTGVFCDARAVRYAENQPRAMRCPNAGCTFTSTSAADLKAHEDACPYFNYECEDCGAVVLRRESKAHNANCPRKLLPCGNLGCGRLIARGDLEFHRDYMCPAATAVCSFCDSTFPRADLASHVQTCPHAPATCKRNCGISVTRGEWPGQAIHDTVCAALPIACQRCGGVQPRFLMSRHAASECPAALQTCRRCGEAVPRALLQSHSRECLMRAVLSAWRFVERDEREVPCPHRAGDGDGGGCGWRGARSMLSRHFADVCMFQPLPCEHGCGALVARNERQRHCTYCPTYTAPRCTRCGALTDAEGREVVVRAASLSAATVTRQEVDHDGRSKTYGEEIPVRRPRAVLALAAPQRELHRLRCPCGVARCSHCREEVPHHLLAEHESSCQQRRVACPRACGAIVAMGLLSAHDASCPLRTQPCPYGFPLLPSCA